MESKLLLMRKVLVHQLRANGSVEIAVSGISMEPFLYQGDKVTVVYQDTYSSGDFIVFFYKGDLLIHRLIKVENGRFFCKGDNALRMEDVTEVDVLGKAVSVNGKDPPLTPPFHLELSHLVNQEFHRCRYDIEKTKQSGIYRFYVQSVMRKSNPSLKYRICDNISSLSKEVTQRNYTELEKKLLTEIANERNYSELQSFLQQNHLEACGDIDDHLLCLLSNFVAQGIVTVG